MLVGDGDWGTWVGLPLGTDQGVMEGVSVGWMFVALLTMALGGACEVLLPFGAGCGADMASFGDLLEREIKVLVVGMRLWRRKEWRKARCFI